MDPQLLQQLDVQIVNQALSLWNQIQQTQTDLARFQDRIANAAATVQAFGSNTASIAQLARSDLKALVLIGNAFLQSPTPVRKLLNIANATIQQTIDAIDDALTASANLQAQAIENLAQVTKLYIRLEELQGNGGELEFAKQTFAAYINEWLNKDFVFIVNNEPLTLRFLTSLNGTFPFREDANLSAKLAYKAIVASVDGIKLKFDNGNATPDFVNARVSSNFDAGAFANSIAGQLASDLPTGLTVKNPKLDTLIAPPLITVDAKLAGLPVFTTMSCEAVLAISPDKVAFLNVSGGIDDLVVPIPPGALAIKGFGFKFQKEPILGLGGPALKVTTSIVPTVDGSTGTTVALDFKNGPSGVYFPIDKLGREFAFQGNLRLLSSITCGTVEGHFVLEPAIFELDLQMPSDDFPKTPFGGRDIFDLKAHATIDSSGIHFDGKATYVKFLRGDVKGDISFSGSGNVMATADAAAFGARGKFSAEWKPGFSNLVIDVSVSVDLSIEGFARLTASAAVRCTVVSESASARVSATILGIPIDQQFTISDDLAATLESLLLPNNNAIVQLVFEKGKQLLKELDPSDTNSFLRRAFASLDPFRLFPAAVPDAGEMFKQAEKAINDAKEAIENAGGQLAEGFKSIAKKGKKYIPGLGLQGEALVVAGPDFPFPTILDNDFLDKIGKLLNELNKAIVADKLANRLAEVSIKEQLPDDGEAKEPVDSRLDVRFDQVIVGADGVNGAQKTASSYYVGFLLVGGSSTRRRGKQLTGDFTQWGCVKFVDHPTAGLLASIFVTVGEQNQKTLKNDASILHAMHKIYHKIKEVLIDVSPMQRFGDLTNLDGDPNDPGTEPSLDPAFGQPPLGKLPVVGKLGVRKVAIVASGARIILLDENGAAKQAGLKVNDVIKSINGTAITSAQLFMQLISTSLDRIVSLEVLSQGATSNVNVSLHSAL